MTLYRPTDEHVFRMICIVQDVSKLEGTELAEHAKKLLDEMPIDPIRLKARKFAAEHYQSRGANQTADAYRAGEYDHLLDVTEDVLRRAVPSIEIVKKMAGKINEISFESVKGALKEWEGEAK